MIVHRVVVVKRWSWYGRAGVLAGVALVAFAVGYDAPAALRGVARYVRRNVAAQRADAESILRGYAQSVRRNVAAQRADGVG
jgi:hypothetical protein